mmetsp:Transcript_3967/g.5967  ORF Transcript_3967/g.5967 Transcript_3967/m.5967 type:complete len:210 (-) Transcript_3967:18-647(-)
MLSSSSSEDPNLLVWTPKSKEPMLTLDQHEGGIREHAWANLDPQIAEAGISSGEGIILTLCTDKKVRIFNIAHAKPDLVGALKHDCEILCMGLSPDNKFLAVGGEQRDIFIWSFADKKLLRRFKGFPERSFREVASGEGPSDAAMANEESTQVFGIGWSFDGATVAAGIERSIVVLEVDKILSQPTEELVGASSASMGEERAHNEIYGA